MLNFYLNNLLEGIKDFMIVVTPFIIGSFIMIRFENKEKEKQDANNEI